MSRCVNCGREIEADAVNCRYCDANQPRGAADEAKQGKVAGLFGRLYLRIFMPGFAHWPVSKQFLKIIQLRIRSVTIMGKTTLASLSLVAALVSLRIMNAMKVPETTLLQIALIEGIICIVLPVSYFILKKRVSLGKFNNLCLELKRRFGVDLFNRIAIMSEIDSLEQQKVIDRRTADGLRSEPILQFFVRAHMLSKDEVARVSIRQVFTDWAQTRKGEIEESH